MKNFELLLEQSYQSVVNHLIEKYGPVPGDYFVNESCRSKNKKITRGKEGLYIHHIDEDKAIMLSTPDFAINNPYLYQRAERLVYCNLLEHLLLHIKIWEKPHKKANKNEIPGVGGIYNFIVPELNDIYSGIVYKQSWKKKVVENVLPYKDQYLKCIKKLVQLKFPYPLLTSYYHNMTIWNPHNNQLIWKELRKLGVKE